MKIPAFRLFTQIGILLLPFCAFAETPNGNEPFTERTPAYFVSRYGSAKSSKTVSKYAFIHPKRGSVEVSGQFSVREFRSGDLLILAVFFLPSLKLVNVTLQLNHPWTAEQIASALAAYPADWKPDVSNSVIKTWTAPHGAKAVYMLTYLQLQSPQIVQGIERSLQEMDAKGKAIPKF